MISLLCPPAPFRVAASQQDAGHRAAGQVQQPRPQHLQRLWRRRPRARGNLWPSSKPKCHQACRRVNRAVMMFLLDSPPSLQIVPFSLVTFTLLSPCFPGTCDSSFCSLSFSLFSFLAFSVAIFSSFVFTCLLIFWSSSSFLFSSSL